MMSDQEFKEQVLNAIEDLKRTNERSFEEVKRTNERSIEEVKHTIEEVKRTNERSFEEVKHNTKSIDNGIRSVETDVAWIKGKIEGKQEAISNKNVKSAIWIALGSAVAAIISLIKSFW